jgi:hypothetical protein
VPICLVNRTVGTTPWRVAPASCGSFDRNRGGNRHAADRRRQPFARALSQSQSYLRKSRARAAAPARGRDFAPPIPRARSRARSRGGVEGKPAILLAALRWQNTSAKIVFGSNIWAVENFCGLLRLWIADFGELIRRLLAPSASCASRAGLNQRGRWRRVRVCWQRLFAYDD